LGKNLFRVCPRKNKKNPSIPEFVKLEFHSKKKKKKEQ